MLAAVMAGVVDAPQLRALVLRVPLAELVAVGHDPFLGSGALLVTTGAAEHGISAHEVLAFGDMPNDIPLLRWAGHGVAVANAHPDVLAAVADHAPANDDDGVAQVLEKLFGW